MAAFVEGERPVDAGRLFDDIVHRGTDPNALFVAEANDELCWEPIAYPRSSTPPQSLPRGAVVVKRALGEGQLGFIFVLGEDIDVEALYGSDGRIRTDVLVLICRTRWITQRTVESTEDVESAEAAPALVGSAVVIEPASGLGTSKTVAPIATRAPQLQMNEILDRELILFARARVVAEWINRNFSATFEKALADSALLARLDVSKDKALLQKLRPFPQGIVDKKRKQLFPSDDALKQLLKPPTDIAGLWPIFDVLHHYGVVLLPPTPNKPFDRPSILARITRVDAKLERERFDKDTAAVEQQALKFKKDVANLGIFHHFVEPEPIPTAWQAGDKKAQLKIAKLVMDLLRRLRQRNAGWLAGTYIPHFWNDFSVDMFVTAGLEASGFWKRDKMRDFFKALNAACEEQTPPGRFAWKGIYNDEGLAHEMNALYGAGRVLFKVDGHGPGPRMHVHLDLRPLVVPFDARTGFWLDGPRVVLSPPPPRPAVTWTPPIKEDVGVDEAVPQNGRGRFRHAALGGKGDNVEARWNVDSATTAGSSIDIVVHLHGYGAPGADFLARKATAAGLEMLSSTGAVRVRASRPTLALVPRGRHDGGSTWLFDNLPDPAAFNALVDAGVAWLAATVLRLPTGSTLTRGRLTVMAHSGGGAGLSGLLDKGLDPDEVVCFDSLYGGEDPIRRWAEKRIASPTAAKSGLRACYTACSGPLREHPGGRWITPPGGGALVYQPPGSWTYRGGRWRLISTEVAARKLQHAIDRAIASLSGGASANASLANRFRVELTSVDHGKIPARYTPLLLDDIAATLPGASPAPPSTARPVCVANNDWLTQPPQKPGSNDPPPPPPPPRPS